MSPPPRLSTALGGFALFSQLALGAYVLVDDYMTPSLLDNFGFTQPAMTERAVEFVSRADAEALGLVLSTPERVTIAVDTTETLTGTVAGRKSVRLASNMAYDTGLFVIDVEHMPGGMCGVKANFGLLGERAPKDGTVNFIDGIHDQMFNAYSLQTPPQTTGTCDLNEGLGPLQGPNDIVFSASGTATTVKSTGQIHSTTCDGLNADGTISPGCRITDSDLRSFGAPFNAQRGGVFAAEFSSTAVLMWFFPRDEIPADLAAGGIPDPSTWGNPSAHFEGNCNFDELFQKQRLMLSTDLCGNDSNIAWTASPACSALAPTCEEYVRSNPTAFADARWEINALKVFMQEEAAATFSTTRATQVPAGISYGASQIAAAAAPPPLPYVNQAPVEVPEAVAPLRLKRRAIRF